MGRDPPSRPRRRAEQAGSLPRVRHPLADAQEDPPPCRAAGLPPGHAPARPKLEPFLPVIHQILEDDTKAPKKQRHTAKRIFERLRDEHGYTGGLTVVKDAVRAWRRSHTEVFLPLSHPPGEAQVDFGEAEVVLAGEPTKVALFVMTLPYSDAVYCQAFPRECTETFLEGHVRAFAFFGGVPARISYDNSKIAVARITGSRDREVTGEFLRLKSHYLFEDHFCLVRRPNEKGHVETLVGYARRNFLVPVPVLHDGLEGLNARLEADCRADLARRLRGKPATKAELLAEERAAFLPLPAEAFEARRVEPTAPTRCRWSGSTPTTTRCRRSTPTTGSRSSGRWTRSGSSSGTGWWPHRGAGAGSRSSSTRSTTWRCWSGSRGRSTSPAAGGLGAAGVLRRAAAAAGGRVGGPGTRQFIQVLRLLETPASGS